MNPQECPQFLSSPQSLDPVEILKKRKIIKKKRKVCHKHLLNLNILLENDPSKLTMRQRILQQKFQNKKENMEKLELISTGLEVTTNKKKRKNKAYKISIPVCSKIRLECDKENYNNNLEGNNKLKGNIKLETDIKLETNIKLEGNIELEDNNKEKCNIKEEYNIKEKCNINEEHADVINEDITKENCINKINNSCIIKDDINLICINEEDDIKEEQVEIVFIYLSQLFSTILHFQEYKFALKNDIKKIKGNEICLYKGTLLKLRPISNLQEILKEIHKIQIFLEDCDIIELNNNLIIPHDNTQVNDSLLEEINKLENIRLYENKQTLNKRKMQRKRKMLCEDFSKKKKEDLIKKRESCINKAAFYITKLENLSRDRNEIYKKCVYYTDLLIKTFKEKGCVCKVAGEIRWFINNQERDNY